MKLETVITSGQDGQVLKSVLRHGFKLSGTQVKRLKKHGSLTVDGLPVFVDAVVKAGQIIRVVIPDVQADFPAEHGHIDVLYEDEYIIAINKPRGMLVHPSHSRYYGTLSNRLLGYYERSGQTCELHVVTRLDRDTGGVVLFAKNAHIRSLLAHTDMKKTYQALVFGVPEMESGIIDLPIERSKPESMIRVVREGGKRAVTHYSVEKVYEIFGEKLSVLRLELETGRTHQIRVHCLAIGHPIIGDTMYWAEESRSLSDHIGVVGQQLDAVELELTHPVTGKRLCINTSNAYENFNAINE